MIAVMIAGCSPAETAPTTTAQALSDPVREIASEMLSTLDDYMDGDMERNAFLDRAIELLEDLDGHDEEYISERFNWAAAGVFGELDDITEASRDEIAAALGQPTKYGQDKSAAELAELYTED